MPSKKGQLIRFFRVFHNRSALYVDYIGKLLIREEKNADIPALWRVFFDSLYIRVNLGTVTTKAEINRELRHFESLIQKVIPKLCGTMPFLFRANR